MLRTGAGRKGVAAAGHGKTVSGNRSFEPAADYCRNSASMSHSGSAKLHAACSRVRRSLHTLSRICCLVSVEMCCSWSTSRCARRRTGSRTA